MRAVLWLREWAPWLWLVTSTAALVRLCFIAKRVNRAYRKLVAITEAPDGKVEKRLRQLRMFTGVGIFVLIGTSGIGVVSIVSPGSPNPFVAVFMYTVLLSLPGMIWFFVEFALGLWVDRHDR